MAPRKPDEDGISSTGGTPAPDVLKPKTEKAKVVKSKAEPKTKVKAEKADKVVKAVKKGDAAGEKKEKVTKPKAEKSDGASKAVKKVEKGDAKEKPKVKAVTGEEAVALIVNYLKAQNRPYSATEVSANLHGKVCF